MWSIARLKTNLDWISTLYNGSEAPKCKSLTEAAILVPIIIRNNVPHVLCTVRSFNLSKYPGQVSFPGGKRDKEDVDIIATAVRETHEEIGMDPKDLKILGQILPYQTNMGHHVTPIVAQVLNFESFSPQLNHHEVSEIFTVPLEFFMLEKYHKCKEFPQNIDGMRRKLDYFEYAANDKIHIIFGLTALIATHVATLSFGCFPEFKYQQWMTETTGLNKDMIYGDLIQKSKL